MSTAERVQEFVTAELLRGALPPGTWVRQDELAERLEVSKIPVREALQRLAALGLVRFESNRGVTVPKLTVDDAETGRSAASGEQQRCRRREDQANACRSAGRGHGSIVARGQSGDQWRTSRRGRLVSVGTW